MPDYAKQGGKVLALQSKSEIRVKYDRTKKEVMIAPLQQPAR